MVIEDIDNTAQLVISSILVQLIRRKMSESKVMSLFKESTDMYCQGNYSACLALLSDCLTLQCDRSILYSNRAIANFHLKQLEDSFQDLQKAIRRNHLNYVAYFNLFSLHFLNQNNVLAFQNLCLCLSSAYTVLCRFNPSIQWIQRSLYYGFNNKQSLLLKAIIIYQKSQLRASLQLLHNVLELEVAKRNKEGVIKYIQSIETQLGINLNQYSAQNSLTQHYTLKTSVEFPGEYLFEEQLTKLLKQFNEVYRLINDQMQMEHEFKGQVSNSSCSELKSSIDEKQIHQVATAYNSIAFSRTAQPEDTNGNQRQLKLLSFIGDNHRTLTSETSIAEKNICSGNKINQKIKFYVEQAELYELNNQVAKLESLYAILSFGQDKNNFEHRTSILNKAGNSIKWCQQTDELIQTSEQGDLKIRILKKKYTSFKDELICQANIKLNKYGPLSLPLYRQSQCRGQIKMRVDCL